MPTNQIMSTELTKRRIAWYKCPISREDLAALNQRSDWKGMLHTAGYLGLLVLTGTSAVLAAGRVPWWALLLILFLHGTFFAFLLNGFHELVHNTVFKTRWLNTVFVQIFSFLSWSNPVMFWASHQEHHKYTLHPPEDLEVVLPVKLTWTSFFQSIIVNPWDLWYRLKLVTRLAFGRVEGRWEETLFPPSAVKDRNDLFKWARIILFGHLLIVAVSLYFHLWMIPVVITLAPFYGGWLQWLCNNTQHAGLQDNVSDFRLCTRTCLLNPFVQFLYWDMNYHIEHHMYAAVPCYNLAKLHQAIEADLPHCPNGLLTTWREIIPIIQRQRVEPQYQFVVELPGQRAAAAGTD
jgi:fatty acid desaturase